MANFLSKYSGAQVEQAVANALSLATVATTGSYTDLTNKPIYCNTTAYWQSQTTFKGNKGDIIIYSDYKKNTSGQDVAGIKIADGTAYAIDLPFISSIIEADLAAHTGNTTVHITAAERTAWNNKVSATIDTTDPEKLILSTN